MTLHPHLRTPATQREYEATREPGLAERALHLLGRMPRLVSCAAVGAGDDSLVESVAHLPLPARRSLELGTGVLSAPALERLRQEPTATDNIEEAVERLERAKAKV
jgi:hypothetical protein